MKKKNLMSIFMSALLVLSILSYVFIFVTPAHKANYGIYIRSYLSEKEINEILDEKKVLILYYWDYECEECYDYEEELKNLAYEFNGSVILDSVNTYEYPQIPYLDLPKIIILGKYKIDYTKKLPEISKIKKDVCDVSFDKIDVC